MDRIRIIIADDHPLLAQGLVHTLSRKDEFQILGQAEDGSSALKLIREYQPDVAILDVQMPEPDGFEVAKIVMNEDIPTKIIFLTMFKEEEFIKKVIELGVKGYVLKENAVMDIVNCVKSVMDDRLFISPQVSEIFLNLMKGQDNNGDQRLTHTENKILKLIAQEKTSKEIAKELFVSVKTIENHRGNICKKLGITGNSALLKYALKNSPAE